MNSTMHFFVNESPFVSHFIIFISSINSLPYCTFFHSLAGIRTMNTRMTASGQGFDFERVVYVGEFNNEEDMENDDLPPDLLRLVEQEERQILQIGRAHV